MKLTSPAALRNREPIAAVLAEVLPPRGVILEVASGSGEHIVYFAERWPHLDWAPSDRDADAVASIQARVDQARQEQHLTNLNDPILFDVESGGWPDCPITGILCINMVHISPWSATQKLLQGAAATFDLAGVSGWEAAPLMLYGPYRRRGRTTAPSNEAFDQSLKARNPEWGLRYVEDVEAEAAHWGLILDRTVEMPANNLTLVFRKSV